MKEVRIMYSQAIKDYPDKISKMLYELSMSDITAKMEDVEFFYYWTILPSSEEEKMDEYKHLLFFNERLEYELDKVTVEIYIRYKTYIRGEDVSDTIKARVIREELSRIIVTSMIIEQKIYNNKDIINSIPLDIKPIEINFGDDLLIDINIDPSNLNLGDYKEEIFEEVYTLDEILEKISNHGIESLTITEREILDELSNN